MAGQCAGIWDALLALNAWIVMAKSGDPGPLSRIGKLVRCLDKDVESFWVGDCNKAAHGWVVLLALNARTVVISRCGSLSCSPKPGRYRFRR